jgi:nucleotide-binding universal stress UspA family protein
MIKDIVVNLSISTSYDPAGTYAVSVADALNAHVVGVAFAYDPPIVYGPKVVPTITGHIPAEMIEADRIEHKKAAKAAIAQFEELTRQAGLSVETRTITASFLRASDLFGRLARYVDLSIVRQAEPDKLDPDALIIESALFDSGKPMLIVPYAQKVGLKLDRVMVCWDGSRTAARAIGDAMPFLTRAKAIEVVMADEPTKTDGMQGADIGQHLARHGLKIAVKRIVTANTDVPSTILAHAVDCSADFIVMGGYGHWRLRECILGGVTHRMLASTPVPTLMSH